jgi:sugar phosphate isomerase/epimerase
MPSSISRRTVLAAPLALRSLNAATPPALGYSLYGLKDLPWRSSLEICSKLGYMAVELALMPGYGIPAADYPAFRRMLGDSGLALAGVMDNLQLLAGGEGHADNIERLKAAREAAVQLGTTVVESVLGGKPGEFDANRKQMVDRLAEWARVFEGSEVRLAVKAHVMQAVQRPEQLLELLNAVKHPSLKAVYDYSHFLAQGLDMEETVGTLAPHIVFVHLKDVSLKPPVRFFAPGTGGTDYPKLASLLAGNGYQGAAVVEISAQIHNAPGFDPLRAVRDCRDKLCAAFTCAPR